MTSSDRVLRPRSLARSTLTRAFAWRSWMRRHARANVRWWEDKRPREDFDSLLVAHVLSPDATKLPMMLLGDPGAGKSMLTKVFAARLPDTGFTVVRVPLRRVTASARIAVQVQEALDQATGGRVPWPQLSDQSAGTIPVILLDGLDELLQASDGDRSAYLQDVLEFQPPRLRWVGTSS